MDATDNVPSFLAFGTFHLHDKDVAGTGSVSQSVHLGQVKEVGLSAVRACKKADMWVQLADFLSKRKEKNIVYMYVLLKSITYPAAQSHFAEQMVAKFPSLPSSKYIR